MNDLLTYSPLAIRATTAELYSARPDAPVVPVGSVPPTRAVVRRTRSALAAGLTTLAGWVQAPPRVDVHGTQR